MLHNTNLVCIRLEVCFIVLTMWQHIVNTQKCALEINSGEWKSFATA